MTNPEGRQPLVVHCDLAAHERFFPVERLVWVTYENAGFSRQGTVEIQQHRLVEPYWTLADSRSGRRRRFPGLGRTPGLGTSGGDGHISVSRAKTSFLDGRTAHLICACGDAVRINLDNRRDELLAVANAMGDRVSLAVIRRIASGV